MSVSFSTVIQKARPSITHVTSAAIRDCLAKVAPTTVTAIGNGFRVACEENQQSKFATVGVWLDTGLQQEHEVYAGTARVLQQCGFLGTTNSNREQISKSFEEIGGQLAADVGRDQSYIAVKVHKDNVNKAVSLLADVIRNARLTDEDIAAAKKSTEQARHESEERPDDVTLDNLWRTGFDSEPNSVGRPLFGSNDGIQAVTRDVLQNYRKENYGGNRMVLVGSGAVNHTQLEKAAQQFFGDLTKADRKPASNRYIGGDNKLWNMRFKTFHVAFGFETCGATCQDTVPLQLATQILGNFHRSQHELGQHNLFRVLKMFNSLDHTGPSAKFFNEHGIETANTFFQQTRDTGLCGQYLVGRSVNLVGQSTMLFDTLQYTMHEWARFAQKVITEIELEQAKCNLKAQVLFNVDGSHNVAQDIGKQVLYHGRRVPLDEMFARIDDVTATNVQEVLHHYYYACMPVISYLGYIYPAPGYDWAQQWTWKYWY